MNPGLLKDGVVDHYRSFHAITVGMGHRRARKFEAAVPRMWCPV
jgi:hypothetical protein